VSSLFGIEHGRVLIHVFRVILRHEADELAHVLHFLRDYFSRFLLVLHLGLLRAPVRQFTIDLALLETVLDAFVLLDALHLLLQFLLFALLLLDLLHGAVHDFLLVCLHVRVVLALFLRQLRVLVVEEFKHDAGLATGVQFDLDLFE
jgi:hypothetical protein